jgi:hypothetical protein
MGASILRLRLVKRVDNMVAHDRKSIYRAGRTAQLAFYRYLEYVRDEWHWKLQAIIDTPQSPLHRSRQRHYIASSIPDQLKSSGFWER